MLNGVKRFLDQRGKRFWWTVRFVLVALIALAIFVLGWSGGDDYVTNIYTELIGVVISIGFTVVFVDRFYANREEMRQTEELTRRLVRDAGSRSNDKAIAAIEELREKKWLEGDKGLLKGAYLPGAYLQNADLYKANLQEAVLQNARLQECQMWKADLVEANLRFVNLQGARLWEANLQCAKLWKANLTDAKLWKTNLQRADLLGAYLQGATLKEAKFNGATTLPDGEMYSSDTEMDRYTNPNHCDFSKTLDDINEIRNSM